MVVGLTDQTGPSDEHLSAVMASPFITLNLQYGGDSWMLNQALYQLSYILLQAVL